jgi:hypothetical protein
MVISKRASRDVDPFAAPDSSLQAVRSLSGFALPALFTVAVSTSIFFCCSAIAVSKSSAAA